MADINEMLRQKAFPDQMLPEANADAEYVPPAPVVTPLAEKQQSLIDNTQSKQAQVAAASDAKRMAMGGQPSAYDMAAGRLNDQKGWYQSDLEKDLATLSPSRLRGKYGNQQAESLIADAATGAGQVQSDLNNDQRSWGEWSLDNTKELATGTLSSVGGLAAWGLGAVSDEAGTKMATALNDFSEFSKSFDSPALAAQRRVQEGVNALNERDNRTQEVVDTENGESGLVAGLKRIGRDAVDSVGSATMDASTFQAGTANALGSLLVAGPLAKGIKAAGSALIPTQLARGAVLASETASPAVRGAVDLAMKAGEKAPILAAIGSMEGGGSYQQVAADVMTRSHETLMQESPMYRELMADQEDTPENRQAAKEKVANRTGLISAAITAPLAAATGTLVSKFEANPFAKMSASKIASIALREPIEEGTQGATSQLAQNFAEKQVANEDKSMTEGVGRQIGEGALYAAGMTGVTQAPNVARAAVKGAANATLGAVDGVLSAAQTKAEANRAANENMGPASRDAISEKLPEVVNRADEYQAAIMDRIQQRMDEGQTVAPEEVEQAQSFAQNFRDTLAFNEDDVRSSTLEALGPVNSRPEAAFKLMDMFDQEKDPTKKADLALDMVSVLSNINEFVKGNVQNINENYGTDENVKSYVDALQDLDQMMYNNPQRARALEEATAIFEGRGEEGNKIDVVDQKSADDAVNIASVAPGAADLDTSKAVLMQAQQGKINITPQQRQSLNVSIALVQAAKAASDQAVALGNNTKSTEVSRNVTTQKGAKGESALEYTKEIVSAYKRGELDIAGANLTYLGNFAQGLQNKVAALNAHAAADFKGKGVAYQTTKNGGRDTPDGTDPFFPARQLAFISPASKKSIQVVQNAHLDAQFLADVYNGLVDAFPDLNAKHITSIPLASEFLLPADTVVENYRSSIQGNSAEGQNATTTPVTATQEQTAQNETVPDTKVPTEAKETKAPVETVAEPVAEVAEPTVEKTQDAPETEAKTEPEPVKPKKKGIAAVYENLHTFGKKGVNNFLSTYKLGSTQVSRVFGEEAPLARMTEALSSSAAHTDFIGSAPQGNLTPEIVDAYADIMGKAQQTIDIVSGRLKTFLDKNYSTKNPVSRRELLLGNQTVTTGRGTEFDPASLTNRAEGKALNITEAVDGDLVFNKELIESAALAAQQFALSLNDSVRDLEAKDVSRITGIPEDSVNPQLIQTLSSGLTIGALKDTLDAKIREYWNVSNTQDGYIGQQEGISGAVAALFVDAMIENGQIIMRPVHITEADGLPPKENGKPNARDINLFNLPANWWEAEAQKYPTAIDDAVLINPEQDYYIGSKSNPPVAQFQMRNRLVENTPPQKEAIGNEQKTVYFGNFRMAALYTAMGKDLVLKGFGAGDMRTKKWNVNHEKSLDGRNRGIAAGYDEMTVLMGRLQNVGEMQGTAWNKTPIQYAFNMTRVGRLQMLGKQNPQSNKFIRSLISPTQSTLDLSDQNSQDFGRFTLGLAQALDIKVHKLFFSQTQTKLMNLLEGKLKPAVDVLANFQIDLTPDSPAQSFDEATLDELMKTFKDAGVPFSPHSLQAVMEYARYRDTPDSRNQFETDLYLEADGVTNGPINAMVLFTTGLFKSSWVKNIGKGGLTFGRGLQSLAQHIAGTDGRKGDDIDLYSDAKDNTKQALNTLRKEIKDSGAKPNVLPQMNHLLKAMDLFFGKDLSVTFDDNGDPIIALERGITKNPLTITIYGSGAKGIASKLTSTLTEAIYERLSLAAQNPNLTPAQAMFGGPGVTEAEANAKFKTFNESMSALTGNLSVNSRTKGYMVFGSNRQQNFARDPENFTFTGKDIENITSSMLTFFVSPMTYAIEQTVGKELLDTASMVRQAVQVQSLVAEDAFKTEVARKLEEKAKDPEWDKSNFLTRAELDEIYKKIAPVSPFIDTGAQRFYIAGSTNNDLTSGDFGATFDGKYPTPGTIDAPGDAGVSGVPYMNIGTGDGYMMQLISNMKDAIAGTLKIFDGQNMPLDKIEEGSRQANQAVWETWMANPLKAVYETNSSVLASMNLKGMSAEGKEKLAKTLFPYTSDPISDAQIAKVLTNLNENLNNGQISIEARHRAMARVQASVDQMAAAATPHLNEGAVPENTSDEGVTALLNEFYEEELAKLKGNKPTTVNLVNKVTELFDVDATGVRTMNMTDIRSLVQELNLPADQQTTLEQIVRGTALADFNVVYGTPTQVANYIADRGLQGMNGRESDGEVKGFTSMADKTVYLLNPSNETLVHELIHAATFDMVASYYGDPAFKKANPQRAAAVQRIETLMEQFLKMNGTLSANLNPRSVEAYNDAYSAIMEYRGSNSAQSKASALNEFMAWNLSNRRLMALLKQTQANPLVRIAQQVLEAIKSMFSRTRLLDDPKQDMFSNLQFNSSMLMYSQPALSARAAQSVLFQSSIYGQDDRLTAVADTFQHAIAQYATTEPRADQRLPSAEISKAIRQSSDIADLFIGKANRFSMNAQQATTFRNIVAALSTEASINPNSLAAATELYTHVIRTLKQEDLIDPTDSDVGRAEFVANQKYNLILGNLGTTIDSFKRSSLMPAFLALATVDDSFRAVLAKMPMPKSMKNMEGTMDAAFENFGNAGMELLGSRMAGYDRQTVNVQLAIDALNQQIQQTVEEREGFITLAANKGNTLVDQGNDMLRNVMNKVTNAAYVKGKEIRDNSTNRYTKLAGNVLAGFSGLINEDNSAAVAEGVLSASNQSLAWLPLRKFMADVVGRTESNAAVYDMIKTTRAMVQQVRQQFREDLPQIIEKQFSRKLSQQEWTHMYAALGRTDMAALRSAYSADEIMNFMAKPSALNKEVTSLEKSIREYDPQNFKLIQGKMKQLATYMNTGVVGSNLLSNADAIALLLGEKKATPFQTRNADQIKMIDHLVTMYSMQTLPESTRNTMLSLVQGEASGLKFTLDYMVGQREEESRKAQSPMAKLNGYKGYLPKQIVDGVSLIVADNTEAAKLRERSYLPVQDYVGSSIDSYTKAGDKSYYFARVSARSAFEQGIMQNARQSALGVDTVTGMTLGQTAGVITSAAVIKKMLSGNAAETGIESFKRIYNENGTVVALERSLDPRVMEKVQTDGELHKMIGIWRGRQAEEANAQIFNESLVDALRAMYDRDRKSGREGEYEDLMNTDDAVLNDSLKLLSRETREYIEDKFPNGFMIRRDLLDDALGYRSATIGDAWTGNTRWSPKTQETVKNLAIGAFGNAAYQKFVNGERILQNVVSDAKVLIVVKSVIVPMANIISNMYQLAARGVPLAAMTKAMPVKTAELTSYIKGQYRLKELEANLRASTGNRNATLKLEAEKMALEDSFKGMSIWPLLEAGEFSSVSDAGITREEIMLSEGRLQTYIENLVSKLPGPIATAGRYGLVTKDTALFQGLQKTVEYGDFLAKAIYYDDLTKRKGLTSKAALGKVTEEFVNYDRLSGRFRGYLESIGMLWFYNFKIRIMKVAASMIRENPLHSLLAGLAPAPSMFGSVGLPFTDSLINKAMDGTLTYSMGPGQGLNAFGLNPWVNLSH